MELHCPECHSIVYSRRALLCGVCGKRLPDSFRFHGEQAEKIEGELKKAKVILKYWQQMPDGKSASNAPLAPYLHRPD
jgi:hypothetical protein